MPPSEDHPQYVVARPALPKPRRRFFDGLWMASAYVDTLAMLPQLWMITKIGGKVLC